MPQSPRRAPRVREERLPRSQSRRSLRAPAFEGAAPPTADGDVLTQGAIEGAVTVREFLKEAEGDALVATERETIIDQALMILQDFYVHLPLKRAMHACDPVQRLRLLRTRHEAMSDRRFHDAMIDIFASLRDLHTNYVLPRPYNKNVAFLPFMLEDCDQPDGRAYLVTRVLKGIDDPDFRPGVEVTHWNGVPIDRVVELRAAREPGSNEHARHARGLERLTVRALALSEVPDEEWVMVGYHPSASVEAKEVRLSWKVFRPQAGSEGDDGDEGLAAQLKGLDLQRQIVSRVRKELFAPRAMEGEGEVTRARARAATPAHEVAAVATVADVTTTSVYPDAFSFKRVLGDKYGYVRIWTFAAVSDENAFAKEFRRICDLLPKAGLILDVRGNGGGYIRTGEMLLQLLTPRHVEPERFHFVNSRRTLELCGKAKDLRAWAPSIAQAVETGAVYSQGFPVTDAEAANALGQAYVGPVVLITDALCYSTTDIFAAGFQDHAIGPVLGVDGNTGAGGANVWGHDLLRQIWNDPAGPLKPLPNGAALRFSIRQSTRVGERLGVPLEDLGVVPDEPVYRMTRDDILKGNTDLIAAAGARLDKEPPRRLDVVATGTAGGALTLTLTTQNLDRVEVFADGRATASLNVVGDGESTHTVTPPSGTKAFQLQGFQKDALVASRRTPIPT